MSPTRRHDPDVVGSALSGAQGAKGAVASDTLAGRPFDHSQPWRAISLRTVGGALIGLIAIALVQSAAVMAMGENRVAAGMMATWGGVLIEAACGLAVVLVALRLPERAARMTWALIGTAATCGAIWDTDWTYRQGAPLSAGGLEVGALQVLLLVGFSVALGACIWYALTFRGRAKVLGAALETVAVGALVIVTLWLKVLQPALGQTRIPTDQLMGYTVVGLGDIAFSFLPLLFVALTIARVTGPGGQRPDWVRMQPWLTALVGSSLTAFSSVGYVYRLSVAPWTPGLLLDFTYLLGYLAFAAAVMLERDAQRAVARVPV